jgi:hypothetical protein
MGIMILFIGSLSILFLENKNPFVSLKTTNYIRILSINSFNKNL